MLTGLQLHSNYILALVQFALKTRIIRKAKYQITPPKAVVRVDRPMKALYYLRIYKSHIGGKSLSSHSCHFVKKYFFLNQTPSCICSMCLYCIGKVSNYSIESLVRSRSAHEGTIYAYTKALIAKNCLSSHSCQFEKKNSGPNPFMHMFNVSTLHRQSIELLIKGVMS